MNQRIATHKPDTEYASHHPVTYRLPRISVPAQHRNLRCRYPPQRSLTYLVKEIAKRELGIQIGENVSDVDELRAMISGAWHGLEDSECAICLVQSSAVLASLFTRGLSGTDGECVGQRSIQRASYHAMWPSVPQQMHYGEYQAWKRAVPAMYNYSLRSHNIKSSSFTVLQVVHE